MMAFRKKDLYFIASLACAIWFACTSSLWTYLMNVFISLPFGVLSYFIWRAGKRSEPESKRYELIQIVLWVGVIIALVSLVGYLMFG